MKSLHLSGVIFVSILCPLHGDTLTLGQAQSTALQQSYAIRASQLEKDAGRFQRNSAIGGFFPAVSLSSTYSRSDADAAPVAEPGGPPPTAPAQPGMGAAAFGSGWSHQITISQPITNGGSEIVAIILSRHGLNALDAQLAAAQQDVLLQVRSAYFIAVVAYDRIRTDSLGLQWARRNLSAATIRHEEGVLPPTDILRWEAEVQDRLRQSLESATAYAAAIRNLLLVMGEQKPGIDRIRLQGLDFMEERLAKDIVIEQAPARNNPSFRAAEAGTRVARNNAALILTRQFPGINGFFTLGWPAQPELIPQGNSFWTSGVQIRLPLLPQVGGYYDYLRARTEWQRSEVTTQQLLHQLQTAVVDSRERYAVSHQSVEAARLSRDFLQRALDAMELRYRAGVISLLELLETRISADQAQSAYSGALAQALIRKDEYRRAMGTLEAQP